MPRWRFNNPTTRKATQLQYKTQAFPGRRKTSTDRTLVFRALISSLLYPPAYFYRSKLIAHHTALKFRCGACLNELSTWNLKPRQLWRINENKLFNIRSTYDRKQLFEDHPKRTINYNNCSIQRLPCIDQSISKETKKKNREEERHVESRLADVSKSLQRIERGT